MSLDKALNSAQGQIPECVAVGYVDMSTGMLLGVKTIDSHPSEVLDLVSAATADLFQGTNVLAIEKVFKRARGQHNSQEHYFQEIVVFSTNMLHMFMRGKRNSNHAMIAVCRSNANIGMVIAKSRMALSAVESAV